MTESLLITIEGICELFHRKRAQVDRYRKLKDFPLPIAPSGSERSGKLLFLRSEVLDWLLAHRRPRTV